MSGTFLKLACIACIASYVLPFASSTATTDDAYATLSDKIEQLEALAEEISQQIGSLESIPEPHTALAEDPPIGVNYIRWGRTWCEGDATIIYRGHVAGPHYLEGGGGSNYLCLHETPQNNRYFPGFNTSPSRIYGVQYVLYENYVFSKNNSNGASLSGFPAPCSACYARNRTSVLMVPARVECPYGWLLEYKGYLMGMYSTAPTTHRTQYLCMDEAPEAAPGSLSYSHGLIYTVEVASGSLPSSSFVDGVELPCVVCTK